MTLYDLLGWKVREEKVAKKKIEYYLYDSNLRPPDHKASALLLALCQSFKSAKNDFN